MYCAECGTKLISGAKYCPECGKANGMAEKDKVLIKKPGLRFSWVYLIGLMVVLICLVVGWRLFGPRQFISPYKALVGHWRVVSGSSTGQDIYFSESTFVFVRGTRLSYRVVDQPTDRQLEVLLSLEENKAPDAPVSCSFAWTWRSFVWVEKGGSKYNFAYVDSETAP